MLRIHLVLSIQVQSSVKLLSVLLICTSVVLLYCAPNHFSRVQLFATSWSVVCQAPRNMEFSRQEYWSGLPFPSPGDLPDPGIKVGSLTSPALAGEFFTIRATWEAQWALRGTLNSVLKLDFISEFSSPLGFSKSANGSIINETSQAWNSSWFLYSLPSISNQTVPIIVHRCILSLPTYLQFDAIMVNQVISNSHLIKLLSNWSQHVYLCCP